MDFLDNCLEDNICVKKIKVINGFTYLCINCYIRKYRQELIKFKDKLYCGVDCFWSNVNTELDDQLELRRKYLHYEYCIKDSRVETEYYTWDYL